MYKVHASLSAGTPDRLMKTATAPNRMQAEKMARRWRSAGWHVYHVGRVTSPARGSLTERAPCVWFDSLDQVDDSLRLVDYADKLARSIRHTGWYTDDPETGIPDTYRGAVVRLPHGKGCPAVVDTCAETVAVFVDDFETIDPNDSERCLLSLALRADSIAERAAEESRDYYERERRLEAVEELRYQVRDAEAKLADWRVSDAEAYMALERERGRLAERLAKLRTDLADAEADADVA